MGTFIDRRTFLRGAGVAMALPALYQTTTRAAGAKKLDDVINAAKQRMVMINTGLGVHTPFLFPQKAGRDYDVTPYLEPLQKVREDFTVMSGLSHPGVDGGHSAEKSYLTAALHPGRSSFKNSISVDQYAAEQIGHLTRFASLQLGTSSSRSLSWTRGGVEIPADDSPSRVFARLFLDGTPDQIRQQVAKLRDGQSIMDTVGVQATDMQRQLGKEDRQTLDQYFTSVRELERRLVKGEEWAKKPKPKVEMKQPKDIKDSADFLGRTQLLFDLVHLAVQTDSTRLITVFIGGTNAPPPGLEGVEEGWHNLSHHGRDEKKIEQLKIIEHAEISVVADLLAKLKDAREGDHTLLDKTMVMYGSNLGNASSHSNKDMPMVLAGGGFNHGQHLAFDPKANPPLANMFVSMLQRMGLETDSFATGAGTLDGLTPKHG
ncbi:MAG: DUF1552 domain-containing protein [Phycisphaera sp.]|nr:DUF1552 domain-containing protein [Phycisphaera sp.]